MTITAKQALAAFGDPKKEASMVRFEVPIALRIKAVPAAIYCNKHLVVPLSRAFQLIISRGYTEQLLTWDGCFNIRKKRGSLLTPSMHSWGLAIDINASWNKLAAIPTMSPELVACFEEAGLEWGGRWRRPDGMHFQLAALPTAALTSNSITK